MPITFQDIFKTSFLEQTTAISVLDMVLAIGLSFAVGLFIGLILLVFSNQKSFDKPYILVVHCEDVQAEENATQFLKEQVKKLTIKSKSVVPGCIELNFEVRLKDDGTEFINTLADMPGISHTVMVSYNGDYMS